MVPASADPDGAAYMIDETIVLVTPWISSDISHCFKVLDLSLLLCINALSFV